MRFKSGLIFLGCCVSGISFANGKVALVERNAAGESHYAELARSGAGSIGEQDFIHDNYIFHTQFNGTGNLSAWPQADGLSGLQAGDRICQNQAAAIGLPNSSSYVAWLSDSFNDAYCRAHGLTGEVSNNCGLAQLPDDAGPWFRLDNTSWGSPLFDRIQFGTQLRTIRTDAFSDYSESNEVYTGTRVDGVEMVGQTCNNWITDSPAASVTSGLGQSSGNDWTNRFSVSLCDGNPFPLGLICLAPGSFDEIVEVDPGVNRRAFVTSAAGNADFSTWPQSNGISGIAGADEICRQSATDAGLAIPETYKAFLNTVNQPADQRFSFDGPVFRLDGVQLSNNLAVINASGSLEERSPYNLTETGVYIQEGFGATELSQAWFGSTFPDFENCGEWTSSDPAGFAFTQFVSVVITGSSSTCDISQRLLCIADTVEELLFETGFEEE